MSAEAKARAFRLDDKALDDDTHAALQYLGVNKEYEGEVPEYRDEYCSSFAAGAAH